MSEWDKELETNEELAAIKNINDLRTKYFLMARRKRDKHGLMTLPPEMHTIAEQLIETDTQFTQEEDWEHEAGVDPLIKVLGPEHPGRTRAVGSTIGLKKGIVGFVGKKRRRSQKEEMQTLVKREVQDKTQEMQAQFQEEKQEMRDQFQEEKQQMQAQFDKQLAMFKNEMMGSRTEVVPAWSPDVRKSSCGSASNFDWSDMIQEPTKCELNLPYGQKRIICAKGMVHPKGEGKVHGVSLLPNHVKVSVDSVEKKFKDFDLPVPVLTAEIDTLQKSLNSFIQWPRRAISFPKPNEGGSIRTVAFPATSAPNLDPAKEALDKLKGMRVKIMKRPPNILKSFDRWMKRSDPTQAIVFDVDPLIFGETNPLKISISPEDIMFVMMNESLDINIITWFERELYTMVNRSKRPNKCCFLNPSYIRSDQCNDDTLSVVNYMSKAIQENPHKSFFVAPYFQSFHWVLFIICPEQKMGYILDSNAGDKDQWAHDLTSVVQTVIIGMDWNLSQCNQQCNTWECGYYVIKWMYDFVVLQQYNFPEMVPWKNKNPFSKNDLDSIVNLWLLSFMNSSEVNQ